VLTFPDIASLYPGYGLERTTEDRSHAGRRSITADTAVRLGRYFGNRAQFWLDLQSQYDIALVERENGKEISRRVRPADAA
jgi:addiction module HigA family antidote